MASAPVDSSGKTTRARSIMTLDGYVSRGKAPPNSVPRDHAMLQDFAAYLELRLKCLNMSMLRRIFADFLNEQENTLVPMMQQGCNIITLFPVLKTSAKKRRQAKLLLAKPKFHLDSRGCVFLYLQYRTATRNMALLKHLFLEFVCQRETALQAFVKRGCQVISVIPFELPQVMPPIRPPPPRVEQESPRAVETATEQQQVAEKEAVPKMTRKKRKGRAAGKEATLSIASSAAPVATAEDDVAAPLIVQKRPRKRRRKAAKTGSTGASGTAQAAAVPGEPELGTKRRSSRINVVSASNVDVGKSVSSSTVLLPPKTASSAASETAQTAAFPGGPEIGTKRRSKRHNVISASSALDADKNVPPASSFAAELTTESSAASTTTAQAAAVPGESGVTKRRSKRNNVVSAGSAVDADKSVPAAVPTPKTVSSAASETVQTAAVPGEPEIGAKRRSKAGSALDADKNVPPASSSAAVPTPKRGRKPKPRTVPPLQEAVSAAASEVVEAVLNEVVARVSGEHPKPKRGRKRKSEAEKQTTSEEKSRKRGKPVMSEEMCRSQLKLAGEMAKFEEQNPWEVVYGKLPAPFDEEKHPALSIKFRKFWHKHSRAVWERKFWAPMSRKLNLSDFNKRNNRQLVAKNAFESLIISAYQVLGAPFFVKLDTQKPQHPGWFYRGPIVALFALQQIKGEDAMWDYVKNEAFERFPDCNLPLPLTASNAGAMRIRHKRESVSMWVANHQLTPAILHEMAVLKTEQQAREQVEEVSQATTAEPDRELGSEVAVMVPLEFI